MSDFLLMGGYAAYVWSAYGMLIIVLSVNLLPPLLRQRRLRIQSTPNTVANDASYEPKT